MNRKDAENDDGLLEWPGVRVGPDHYYTGQWRGARKMGHTDGSTHEGEWGSDEPCGRGLEKIPSFLAECPFLVRGTNNLPR